MPSTLCLSLFTASQRKPEPYCSCDDAVLYGKKCHQQQLIDETTFRARNGKTWGHIVSFTLSLLPRPLLTLVTYIPNSCYPTLLFCLCYSRLPARRLRRMSLEVMTILCHCENIETSEGVPLDVTGVAQVMHCKRPKKRKLKQGLDTGKCFNWRANVVCLHFSILMAFFFGSGRERVGCH